MAGWFPSDAAWDAAEAAAADLPDAPWVSGSYVDDEGEAPASPWDDSSRAATPQVRFSQVYLALSILEDGVRDFARGNYPVMHRALTVDHRVYGRPATHCPECWALECECPPVAIFVGDQLVDLEAPDSYDGGSALPRGC